MGLRDVFSQFGGHFFSNIQEHQKKALVHLPEADVEKTRVRREAENAFCIRNDVKNDVLLLKHSVLRKRSVLRRQRISKIPEFMKLI
ncbi:hypothetical protein [Methanosarcina sp. 1.H.A.2.2]|uniref:hypothetical protein n=1 Tax=Methanosarcina sp. 1.H.A.2.2 TaxID=1483601 RepID=UPI000622351F|nr:hypothetical protein [Methanosarcina sp. 1.H.A.2.2]KKH50741.1 hypothetical protein EO93_12615 [Methanosarcina sp. 1.H.A.2.2]